MNPQGTLQSARTDVGTTPTAQSDVSTGQEQSIGIGIGLTSQNAKKPKIDKIEAIRPLIASQFPALQGTIERFALSMLDLTARLRARETTVSKFLQTDDQGKPFIPRSARVNITLNSSEALANDAGTTQLKGEVRQTIEDFEKSMAKYFQRMAKLELKQATTSRLQEFINQCVNLTDYLIMYYERISGKLTTMLGHDNLIAWTLFLFFRHVCTVQDFDE